MRLDEADPSTLLGRRLAVTVRRTILAPADVAFAVYTDPSRMPEWQPGLRGVRSSGSLDQAGSSHVLEQSGPRLSIEVIGVVVPTFHRQLESFRWYRWIGTARFEPLDRHTTRFSYEYAPRPKHPLGWLVAPLLTAIAVVFMSREFDLLKLVAERTAPGGEGNEAALRRRSDWPSGGR
jgi:hypothetical protein